MTSDEFYSQLVRSDGAKLTREEFIRGLTLHRELSFNNQQAGRIYEALDADGSGDISRNEFKIYIEGIKQTKE